MRIVGVSDVNRYIRYVLEDDLNLQDIWVRGEVTNYVQSSAGHRYFSLKDESSVLRCVLFNGRGATLPPLRNGMAILAHGKLTLYEARGDFQLYVDAIEDAGIGALHLRFEALKARLEAEGLFDQDRKRPLPPVPAVIGVVTSPTAAALRDILRTLRLRCPLVRVILAPTLVQGIGAAEQIAAALDMLNAHGETEVIIVARGGGSPEELWAFNEEAVAHAIARSRAPVVTGVGHETDFTIADFVADQRASTPTAAATLVAPDWTVWQESLAQTAYRLQQVMLARVAAHRERLGSTAHQLTQASPGRRLAQLRQRVDEVGRALEVQMSHLLEMRHAHLRSSALQLNALSPLLTLGRGYAIVRRESDGHIVTSVHDAQPGQTLSVRVADGVLAATVDATSQGAPLGAIPLASHGAGRPAQRAGTKE